MAQMKADGMLVKELTLLFNNIHPDMKFFWSWMWWENHPLLHNREEEENLMKIDAPRYGFFFFSFIFLFLGKFSLFTSWFF